MEYLKQSPGFPDAAEDETAKVTAAEEDRDEDLDQKLVYVKQVYILWCQW